MANFIVYIQPDDEQGTVFYIPQLAYEDVWPDTEDVVPAFEELFKAFGIKPDMILPSFAVIPELMPDDEREKLERAVKDPIATIPMGDRSAEDVLMATVQQLQEIDQIEADMDLSADEENSPPAEAGGE
jgi:hypothetical protein